MDEPGPKDRVDLPIWNAIDAKNFKQALKLVDKRLAKKSTDYYKALKVYISSYSMTVTELATVLVEIVTVAKSDKALDLDALELYDHAFDRILPDQKDDWGPVMGRLRWIAVKNSPKNEELGLKCFKACLAKDDIEDAQQIANSLDKNFLNNHGYGFWNIVTQFLYSQSPKCPENKRKILGGISKAQIERLATATKQAENSKSLPVRAIQTPQEVLLLHRILSVYGTKQERLEYYKNRWLGPDSKVAKGTWKLWTDKLKLMEDTDHWEELFESAGSLLRSARTKNETGQIVNSHMGDWAVWKVYIRAAIKLRQSVEIVSTELAAHIDKDSGIDKVYQRNACLASLQFTFVNAYSYFNSEMAAAADGSKIWDIGRAFPRVTAIIMHLQNYGTAASAYDDVKPYAEVLNDMERIHLMGFLEKWTPIGGVDFASHDQGTSRTGRALYRAVLDLTTSSKITASINSCKLQYLLTNSAPAVYRKEKMVNPALRYKEQIFTCPSCRKRCGLFCDSCLEEQALIFMISYGSAVNDGGRISKTLLPTDSHPADDFCILAAMCLMKLAGCTPFYVDRCAKPLEGTQLSHLLQAIVLLQYAWSHSKSNSRISLLLVRLYSYLGCGSLAMRAYQRLGIKQIQHDTLAYTLFDRISSLHPHPFAQYDSSKMPSPIDHLVEHQKVYKTFAAQIRKNSFRSFEHGSYDTIFQLMEVTERLSHSKAAILTVVESRKISRLTEPGVALTMRSHGYDILPSNAELYPSYADNFDYESFPDFEASQSPRFEAFTRSGPPLSTFRCRNNLLAERLMMIIDPKSESDSRRITHETWVKNTFKSSFMPLIDKEMESGLQHDLTFIEQKATGIYISLISVIQYAVDVTKWSSAEFQYEVDVGTIRVMEGLDQFLKLVGRIQASKIPAFLSTLHPLYVAHEVATTVMNFVEYFAHPRRKIQDTFITAKEKISVRASNLMKEVLKKADMVKKKMDEGGWIDIVKEGVLQGYQELENPSQEISPSLAGALKAVVGEEFLEEWASDVVYSWRESVTGLACLKKP